MCHKRSGEYLFEQPAEVIVIDTGTALGVDDPALALDDFRDDCEILHTIGFQLNDCFERRFREPVLVDSDILGGVGIVRAAGSLHDAIKLARLEIVGTVEHHVFKEMR